MSTIAPRCVIGIVIALAIPMAAVSARAQPSLWNGAACSPRLKALFAPPDPITDADRSGGQDSADVERYLVCHSSRPFDELRPSDWPIERLPASDVFAGLSPAVRRALGLLFGGQRLEVAHGWLEDRQYVDGVTLIAPAPAETLDRVVPGTLIIRTRATRRRP